MNYMIDTHAHIFDEKFYGEEQEVIKNAKSGGIKKIVNIALNFDQIEKTVNFQENDNTLFLAYGIHPADIENSIKEESKCLQKIEELAEQKKIVAVGEIGLDYHWIKDPQMKEEQKRQFELQIEIAKKYNLPIIIHAREAIEDVYEILQKHKPVKGVMHSFSGNSIDAKKFIDLGMVIGVSGIVTFKNNLITKEMVLNTDINKILIETDCPYLAPVPHRGKRNEPKYVVLVAEEISKIKSETEKPLTIEEVASITSKNAEELFNI